MAKVLSIMVIAVFLSACGGGSSKSDEGDKTKNTSFIEKYEGTWTSPCNEGDIDEYETISVIFEADTVMDVQLLTYSDSSCTKLTGNQINNYKLKVGKEITSSDGIKAFEIDTTYTGFKLILGTFEANAIKMGETFYHIVGAVSDKLYFGKKTDSLDTTTADKRPTALDLTDGFTIEP